ncbi:PH domain-containing protein [Prevotella sp. HUN102]|uniref:PH domain-containing protein n=1 Tax=Prevotella sp. HUN102 TaxID=1392486 RepID=UPI00048AC2E6|nr:PH domain-containing protein [Prevotella sp. HUN102]
MNRTFNHRIMILEWCSIALFALGMLYGVWNRQNVALVILGVVFVFLTIVALERAVHTSYVLTEDGKLIINRGRFTKTKTILLTDIQDVREMPLAFGLGSFVLIEMKNGRMESVQPDNKEAFIKAIQKQ